MQNNSFTSHKRKLKMASLPMLAGLFTGMMLISSPALSADQEYEVQSGDSLSRIVAKHYPDVSRKSYSIVMEHVLKNNPDAFANKNINSLRLGKTLKLDDKEKIKGLQPAPPKPVPVNPVEFKKLQDQNSELQKQLKELQARLGSASSSDTGPETPADSSTDTPPAADNGEQVASLQAEITQLKESIKKLEDEKAQQVASAKDAESSDADKEAAAAAQQELAQLKTQLAELKTANEKLSAVDTEALNKQIETLKGTVEEQKDQIAQFNTEKEAKISEANTELETANKQIAELKKQVRQLTSDKEAKSGETNTALENANQQVADLKKQLEQLTSDKEAKSGEANSELESANQQIAELKKQVESLTSEKEAQASASTELEKANQQAAELKKQTETLTANLKKQETQAGEKLATAEKAAADAKQKSEELSAKVEQLDTLVKKYEADQEEASAKVNEAANTEIASLKSEVESLNAQVKQLEADKAAAAETKQADAETAGNSQKAEELQAELDMLQGLMTKYEADQEESDKLIKELQAKVGAEGSDAAATAAADSAKLQKENELLKSELEKAKNKAVEDSKTIASLQAGGATSSAANTTPSPATNTTPQAATPASKVSATTEDDAATGSGASKSLSWLLPLLALMAGLFALTRFIKNYRDKKATEEFKTAMATSASSKTASAFGVDGSAPAPYVDPEKASDDSPAETTEAAAEVVEEEDSLEASVKLDIARAYIDLGDADAANEILEEVMIEGSSAQKAEAEKLRG